MGQENRRRSGLTRLADKDAHPVQINKTVPHAVEVTWCSLIHLGRFLVRAFRLRSYNRTWECLASGQGIVLDPQIAQTFTDA